MSVTNESLSYVTKAKDFINRAVRQELHLPPWWLRDVGGANFTEVGREFLNLFKNLVDLQPAAHILEIGCGSGRIAIPLTNYLTAKGRYVGLDITLESIQWCRRHISPNNPNFHFLHANLYNKRYNPQGQCLTRDYIMPFANRSFDFIYLTSVFTHLLPDDTANYFREIARLLRPGGCGLLTFFILNEEQKRLSEAGHNDIAFIASKHPYRLRDEAIPESAVAYEEPYLRELLAQCGLDVISPIQYGTWRGQAEGLSYQDIIMVRPR